MAKSKFLQEKDVLTNSIIQNTFFYNWGLKRDDVNRNRNLTSIELMVTSKCNNACKYCYLLRHKELHGENDGNAEMIVKNTKRCLKFLSKNKYSPAIELFCGDFFYQEYWEDILEAIYVTFKDVGIDHRPPHVSIPSNMWWLMHDDIITKYKEYASKLDGIGIDLHVSASVDGKYCDANRPSTNLKYTDEFYDRLFKMGAELKYGFHPMVYSNDIEHWVKNFDWFIENMNKYNAGMNNLYLLELGMPSGQTPIYNFTTSL